MAFQDILFYFKIGWSHIVGLDALDHQLFILALVVVYSVKQVKQLLILITAFTIGHSLTLALSVLDYVRFPSNWIEFLIPCTIVITALFNLFRKEKRHKKIELNYYLALFFGLVHGMGFANSVQLMLAQDQQLVWGLLGFNLGLEIGQIVFVVMFILLSILVLDVFRVRRRDWVIFVSSAIFALSLEMALQRIP